MSGIMDIATTSAPGASTVPPEVGNWLTNFFIQVCLLFCIILVKYRTVVCLLIVSVRSK